MAKSRTYNKSSKSKSSFSKKSGFFTKRKIALGVALIALVGIGVVLYSNASVGDPPMERTLYCKQGNCYETQVRGTQRAALKALVRDTSKAACASTSKEWALKREAANKQASQWVCVKSNDPGVTPVPPTQPVDNVQYVSVNTPCFIQQMPVDWYYGVFSGQNTQNLSCLGPRRYNVPNLTIGQFDIQGSSIRNQVSNLQDEIDYQKRIVQEQNRTIISENPNYILGGKQVYRLETQGADGQRLLTILLPNTYPLTTRQTSLKDPSVFEEYPVTVLKMTVEYYGGASNPNGPWKPEEVKKITDHILANWIWK